MRSSNPGELIVRNKYTRISSGAVPIYRPILQIKLLPFTTKGKPVNAMCIIDSGADYNLLPASFCKPLGHDLKKGGHEPITLTGIGGKITGHLHTNQFVFDKEKLTCEFFMCENWETGIGLLGHSGRAALNMGFFENYRLLFNTAKKFYEIYK